MHQRETKNESFLAYLQKKGLLDEEQIQSCRQELESTSQDLAQILLQKNYCNDKTLNQYQTQFAQEQQTNSFTVASFEEKTTSPDEANDNLSFRMHSTTNLDHFTPQNRYVLLGTIGEGGMGIVQKAVDTVLGREIALKKVNAIHYLSSQLSQKSKIQMWRLSREAEITAILEHPNIIPIYDLQHNEQKELYFTMRKVEGETLSTLLRREHTEKGTFREEQRLSVFLKVCDAVSYAHSRNIIHRDLKPDNIMVGKFGEVYVMDWGIAKKLEEPATTSKNSTFTKVSSEPISSQTNENNQPPQTLVENATIGELINTLEEQLFQGKPEQVYATIGGLGTPGYMPPEQQKNAFQATQQSDIYALGIILRQCFVLFSPYEEVKILCKSLDTPHSPTKRLQLKRKTNVFDALIPSDLQAIIQKATHSELEKRYKTVQELTYDIECYQKNIRVSAREYNPIQLFFKWIRRNKILFSVISGLFLLLTLFGIYLRIEKKKQLEIQIHHAIQNAYREEMVAKKQENNAGIQIKSLLKSLHYLDIALSLKPSDQGFEQKKYDIGQKLIQLACQSEDYTLAEYVSAEMNSLSLMTPAEKTKQQTFIQTEKNRLLEEHRKRLQFWVNELKRKPNQKTKENAVLEITQMEEKEIFQEILTLVIEGTDYLLQEPFKNTGTTYSYQAMFEVLKRKNQQKAVPTLVQQLQKIKEKWLTLPYEEIENAQCGFTIDLLDTLNNLKAKNIAKMVQEIREHFAPEHKFFKDSEIRYYRALELEEKTSIPKTAEEFLARGQFRNAIQDIPGAIEDFTQAIQLDPTYVRAYLLRAKVYEEKEPDKALKDYSKALQLDPDNNQIYALRGELKFNNNDIKGAARDFQKYIQKDQSNANVYRLLGMIRRMLKDLKGAISEYDKSIPLAPNQAYLRVLRGIVKFESGDLQGALADYNQALTLNPNIGNAYSNRGVVLLSLGDVDGALFDFNHAIEREQVSPYSFLNRGDALIKKGDIPSALLDYHQALQISPTFLDAGIRLFDCYQQQNKHTQALQIFENILANQPHLEIYQHISNILASYILEQAKRENWLDLKPYLLFFKKHSPLHPRYKEIQDVFQKLEQIEKEKK